MGLEAFQCQGECTMENRPSKVELLFFMTSEAVKSVRKELKTRKREHPALFMLGAVGKHLYEAAQAGVRMSIDLNSLWNQ